MREPEEDLRYAHRTSAIVARELAGIAALDAEQLNEAERVNAEAGYQYNDYRAVLNHFNREAAQQGFIIPDEPDMRSDWQKAHDILNRKPDLDYGKDEPDDDRIHIGWDLDGVTYDFNRALRLWLIAEGIGDEAKFLPSTRWEFFEDWGFSVEEFIEHCANGVDAGVIFRLGRPLPRVVEQMRRLSAAGFAIDIITDRSFGEDSEANTLGWLETYDVPFDSITFTGEKAKAALDHEISYHIDDRPKNVRALRDVGIEAILLDADWNQEAEDLDNCRVTSVERFVDYVIDGTTKLRAGRDYFGARTFSVADPEGPTFTTEVDGEYGDGFRQAAADAESIVANWQRELDELSEQMDELEAGKDRAERDARMARERAYEVGALARPKPLFPEWVMDNMNKARIAAMERQENLMHQIITQPHGDSDTVTFFETTPLFSDQSELEHEEGWFGVESNVLPGFEYSRGDNGLVHFRPYRNPNHILIEEQSTPVADTRHDYEGRQYPIGYEKHDGFDGIRRESDRLAFEAVKSAADERTSKSGETMSESSTGAKKGTKLARFDLIPAIPHWDLAEHFGKGARKYADRNWENGYEWSKSISALERHLNLFKQGIDYDVHDDDCPEDCVEHTGSSHIIAVMWHTYCLAEFARTHPEFDDRAKGTVTPEP